MVSDLLPRSVETLREFFRSAYRDRPVILLALEYVLDGIKDRWGNQGLPSSTAERLNREVLPLLLAVMDVAPEDLEQQVSLVLTEWRRIAPTLDLP